MLKYAIAAALLGSTAQGALAQQVLDAGSQIRQLPPPLEQPSPPLELNTEAPEAAPVEDPAGPSVVVTALNIEGQTLFPEAELIAATGFKPGASFDLAGLRALAARVSAFYNDRGYFLSRAYLPAQEVSTGNVTIAVLEARYGAVSIDRSAKLNDGVADGLLKGLESGDMIASAPLERRLLLLSDLPGVVVRSTLAPGTALGTSDLAVALTPGRRISGSVEADNAGNRYTGRHRVGGSLNLNNPTGLGDRLGLRVLASTSDLAYGRLSYDVPLGALRIGAAFSHLTYGLGREFTDLDADGTANIASLYASYPLVRSRDANLYALGSIDAKWLKDRIGLVSASVAKRSQTATLGLSGDVRDGWAGGGWTSGSIGWTHGNLDLRNPVDRAADALTARTDGAFDYLQYALSRQQAIAGPLSLFAAVRGQIAFANLDSSEKMELGGAYGVRAYPEGEAYGDEGFIATTEMRLMLDALTGQLPGRLQVFGFIDYGEMDFSHRPWLPGANGTRRSGYGGGIAWFGPDNLVLRGTYATRLGNEIVTSQPDKSGRFWFQLTKLF